MVGFKDGFIWFKEWYCCFGKYPAKPAYQFNLPEETAWWTSQAGSQGSVEQPCSWAPITAAVTVQGSLRLLLSHKTGVQGLSRNSRIWSESDCCPSRGGQCHWETQQNLLCAQCSDNLSIKFSILISGGDQNYTSNIFLRVWLSGGTKLTEILGALSIN